jgi:RNA polymerase sigma factor FliA
MPVCSSSELKMNLCAAYASGTTLQQGEVIQQYASLVKRIAHHLMARLPSTVQVDDLIQAGMLGLLDAARNFDASFGASFETHAGTRIRGAMLDEVRRSDWAPRSVHRKMREAAEAIRVIENREGRAVRDAEVAQVLGISLDEYARIQTDAASCRLLSMEDLIVETGEVREGGLDLGVDPADPLAALESAGFRQGLIEAIEHLPEREKLALSLYYEEDLNLREIGAVLGVSESRVCQIHGQAMIRLRARLRDWLDAQACAPTRHGSTPHKRLRTASTANTPARP